MFYFFGLKSNKSKCEIFGTRALKEFRVVLCGIGCIDLFTDTVEILGIHFSYDELLEI